MPAVNSAALLRGRRVAEYEIVRALGAGGFGITYLAFDHQLDGPVALKEYFPADVATRIDDSRVAATSRSSRQTFAWGLDRFLEEARAIHRFRHPNVVRVYRYLEAQGTAYIVMEYLEGESLKAILDRRGNLPAEEWRPLLDALLDGLAHVHSHSYLHRDIKPANVVVRAEDGEPVLIDFGAARVQHRDRTHTQVLTAGYALIEQYSNVAAQDPPIDIYALAAVSYRALTGSVVASAPDRVVNDDYEPLAERTSGADGNWLTAIDRGLAVRPEDRHQTVDRWRKAIHVPGIEGSATSGHGTTNLDCDLVEPGKARHLTPADLGEAEWPWEEPHEDWVWFNYSPDTEIDQVILAPNNLAEHQCADLLREGSYLAVAIFETVEIHPVPVRWLGLHRLSRRIFDWLWPRGWFARLLALALQLVEATVNGRLYAERELRDRVEPRYREEARRRSESV